MKYVLILPDGMADKRYPELDNRSPVEYASTPVLDELCSKSFLFGKAKTVPQSLSPGSDVAIMSVLGYDPEKYFMSRGPLEAINLNIPFSEHDIIFRINNVTFENGTMSSSNAYHIKTDDSFRVIDYFSEKYVKDGIRFFPGTGYRHIMLADTRIYPELDSMNLKCVPPHDIVNQNYSEHLPSGPGSEILTDIIKKSYDILKDYNCGNHKPNAVWPWGQGKPKQLENFRNKFNVKGAVISAVDLINGLGKFTGLEVINVEGATGYYDTNFEGKAQAATDYLKRGDFIFVHIEATDEAGHDGNIRKKIEMIETVDKKIIRPIYDFLKSSDEDYRIMILPDHPTPVDLRTHTSDPVPYIIFDSRNIRNNKIAFSEFFDFEQKNFFNNGYELIDVFLNKNKIN